MKTIVKTLTHNEIYDITVNLIDKFTDTEDIYLPAMISFSIQKNKQKLLDIANEIEEGRMAILKHYNVSENNEEIQIDPEKIEQVNSELKDLLSIQQDVKLYTFKIEELGDVKFTTSQMQSILFMIDED